ncbi:MAG: hypothetical protein P4N60_11145 [Verrucomicrobiae bacterium]|nr:hypothetical protein [Verrucomicrobiae bacterium]
MSDQNTAIGRAVVALLLNVAKNNTPEHFRAMLTGTVANVVGNLPDTYWRDFLKIEICSRPGCDCYKLQEQFSQVADALRDDRRKTLQSKEGGAHEHPCSHITHGARAARHLSPGTCHLFGGGVL